MEKKKQSRLPVDQESDDLIFAVCERFFKRIVSAPKDNVSGKKGDRGRRDRAIGAAAVAEEISKEFNRDDINRERIYPLLWEAINREFLVMNVPSHVKLQDKLIKKFKLRDYLDQNNGEIIVTNSSVGNLTEHVNSKAADVIISLIDLVSKEKKNQGLSGDSDAARVHLGFGAGSAAEKVAKKLSVRAGSNSPKLMFHALTSGGQYLEGQQKAPTTYFSFFDEEVHDAKFVGMFTPTAVLKEEFETLKHNPSYQFVRNLRHDVDILVTSLAWAEDKHGLLKKYYEDLIKYNLVRENVLEDLKKEGWVGDVMFLPYSTEKAIESQILRPVTLFNFNELCEFSKQPGKYVVITCSPCNDCNQRKTEAIRPLLENPNLRMWTHLIIDRPTAEDLVGESFSEDEVSGNI